MNKEGTYNICSNCKLKPNCCTHFDKIDAPVLNDIEKNIIMNKIKKKDFFHKTNEKLYRLKTVDNHCIFYINNHCTIYNIRPTDCKLYPFDIIKKNNKYYLILYELKCIKNQDFSIYQENIEKLVNEIKPWIEDFTDIRNFAKLKNIKYKIIKEINI